MLDIHPLSLKLRSVTRFDFFKTLSSLIGQQVIPATCGRSAMVEALRAWGFSRADEVLVPRYLCSSVITALGRVSSPVLIPSSRTRAVLVYHQLGFPQNLETIATAARKNRWKIINNLANTVFTKVDGRFLTEWGDAGVLSFSKLYPVLLGGGLIARDPRVAAHIRQRICQVNDIERRKALEIFLILRKYHRLRTQALRYQVFESHGVLPEIFTPPPDLERFLPQSIVEIEEDVAHRRKIWDIVRTVFPKEVCQPQSAQVIPFAVPIRGPQRTLAATSLWAQQKLNVTAPVLHFDFNCNMLRPCYQKALVIGCHKEWSESIVEQICHYLRKKIK